MFVFFHSNQESDYGRSPKLLLRLITFSLSCTYLITPAGDVLLEDFEEQAEHFAGTLIGVDVSRGTVSQSAAELHAVGIMFASGMVGKTSHEAHVIFKLAL